MVPLEERLVIQLGSVPLEGISLIYQQFTAGFVSRSERACHPERRRREGSVDSRTPHSTLPWDRDAPGTNLKPGGTKAYAIHDAGDPQGIQEGGGRLRPPGRS